jgi:hypothetical protein
MNAQGHRAYAEFAGWGARFPVEHTRGIGPGARKGRNFRLLFRNFPPERLLGSMELQNFRMEFRQIWIEFHRAAQFSW